MADDQKNPDGLMSDEEAHDIVGKYILVGLTHVDADRNPRRYEQVHGRVVRANRNEGIVLQRPDGSEYPLPPSIQGFEKGEEGEYELRSTGEIVNSPDYVVTFFVSQQH